MRKYHPDLLPPAERESVTAMDRVQALNEAYHILRDNQARLAYDTERATSPIDPYYEDEDDEPIAILTRCAATADEFKIMLDYDDRTGLYYVIDHLWLQSSYDEWEGMEPFEPYVRPGLVPQREAGPAGTVQFSRIEWAGFLCPSCQGMLRQPSGRMGTWIRCSGCGHIRCAGGTFNHHGSIFSRCPWCDSHNRITRQVATGAAVNMPVNRHQTPPQRPRHLQRPLQLPRPRRRR